MPIAMQSEKERPGFLARIGEQFNERPMGVTLFAAVLAVIVLAIVARMVMGWSHREEYRLLMDPRDFDDLAMFLIIGGPVAAAWLGSLCYGLWNMQRWARHSVTGTAVMVMITRFPGAIIARVATPAFRNSSLERATLIRILACLVIAVYFQSPAVAAAFRDRSGATEEDS